MIGRNPFPVGFQGTRGVYLDYDFSIAVDRDRLYLSSLDHFGPNFLWTWSLSDTGAWSKRVFSPKDTVLSLTPAARDGLLVLFEAGSPSLARVSTDQGHTFREIPIGSGVDFLAAALSRTHWALAARSELLLSSDSGRTWKTLRYRGPFSPVLLSLTDTTLYTGGMNQLAFRDSSWSLTPAPGPILAASDTALYAVKGDTLWAKRLPPGPTAVQDRRAPSRRPGSRDAKVRDILGKISRRPASSPGPKPPTF